MSYLALARKWRPKTFSELVGQEHVVKALRNALDTGRVHHAFLFTGTRGVGKTTIARIFAKSLNCETGVGSDPCGQCAVCRDVDAGRFVDLIEIDAASNTGVDDVRDLIDSAQYAPARGRYKVFLIDEVHMLTKNAFNALLKTLEEPPEHVKFLLATTDPQKLPVTVLSRCLQFSLRRLRGEEISGQMARILAAEGIDFEAPALDLLAHAADGSVRDGLSLLDQAIAHGGGRLAESGVRAMLGSVDHDAVLGLLDALAAGDGAALYAGIEALAGYVLDFGSVLDALALALHRVQLRQLLPEIAQAEAERMDPARLQALAGRLAPEDVQLFYQIAGAGRRDLALAPSARVGFEMTLLRMLAFQPEAPGGEGKHAAPAAAPRPSGPPPVQAREVREPVAAPAYAAAAPGAADPAARRAPAADAPVAPPSGPSPPAPAAGRPAALPADTAAWMALLPGLGLGGPVRQLADNCAVIGVDGVTLRLAVRPEHEIMLTDMFRKQIEQALERAAGLPARVRFELAEQIAETPAQIAARRRQARQSEAEAGFAGDPAVRAAMAAFDAEIVPGSIRPL